MCLSDSQSLTRLLLCSNAKYTKIVVNNDSSLSFEISSPSSGKREDNTKALLNLNRGQKSRLFSHHMYNKTSLHKREFIFASYSQGQDGETAKRLLHVLLHA